MEKRLSTVRSKLVIASVLGAVALGAAHSGSAIAQEKALPNDAPAPAAAALDTVALVAKVKPAVVNIVVEQARKAPASSKGGRSPFDFFGEHPGFRGPNRGPSSALGSGFVFDDKGHVLTNAHVVEGAEIVRVKLADERELEAKVKGRDERLDVAVLEIVGAKNLPYVSLGSSSAVQVGEPVVAIGNPFGLGHTVTTGIVSAKGRAIGAGPYDDFLQTDASINPGNSGGPLFDARGKVVGMNTAINPNGQGIGFAIPADEIREVLAQLVNDGHVRRGRLGVHIQDVDAKIAAAMGLPSTAGALVGGVEKDGPAAKAGLRAGDVIARVEETDIANARELSRTVARHAPGSSVRLTVTRAGKPVTAVVRLAALDEPEAKAKATPGESTGTSGSLGLHVADADGRGAVVRRVSPDGPAAGVLAPGDVIVEVDRQPIRTAAELQAKSRKAAPGKPLLLRVEREGATRFVAIERK